MPTNRREWAKYLDFYRSAGQAELAERNVFLKREVDRSFPPSFAEVRHLLPSPHWPGHDSALAAWWKVWELAFRNTKRVSRVDGFVSPYIDTAFNDCLFMWDSVFILMFARYGVAAFDFQRTLDNFYRKQHVDGFISRELHEWDGQDQFHRHDPVSTGPNVLGWSEWEYFLNTGDRQRVADVFYPLLAYHRWLRTNRTWKDGSYFSCGLACGMDNQPRVDAHYDDHCDHGHLTWIDATSQAVLSGRTLLAMAGVLGCQNEVADLREEVERLSDFVNRHCWQEQAGLFGDIRPDGSWTGVKSVAAFWPLLAEIAAPQHATRLAENLEDPATFNRPHRVPTLSADHPAYVPAGGYWKGSVWCPTNYMVLRGLTRYGYDKLAHEIGMNHHANCVAVFAKTGTVWENYAPEAAERGNHSKGDFVGWGGMAPVVVLLEYVFGLRPDVPAGKLVWDVRLTEEFGVDRYPFGRDGTLDLRVAARKSAADEPVVTIRSNRPLTIDLRWQGGTKQINVQP